MFYTWDDSSFADFMGELLLILEPRCFTPNMIIIDDDTKVYEIFFITRGSASVRNVSTDNVSRYIRAAERLQYS